MLDRTILPLPPTSDYLPAFDYTRADAPLLDALDETRSVEDFVTNPSEDGDGAYNEYDLQPHYNEKPSTGRTSPIDDGKNSRQRSDGSERNQNFYSRRSSDASGVCKLLLFSASLNILLTY